jgi:D-aspartate ligase
MKKQRHCALIIGGNKTGYSVVRELNSCGVEDIFLIYFHKNVTSASNQITFQSRIINSKESIKKELFRLRDQFTSITIFPVNDPVLNNLYDIYDEISSFCFVPINYEKHSRNINKYSQYQFCEKNKIPCPPTLLLNQPRDLEKLYDQTFPIIIKPVQHQRSEEFRWLYIPDLAHLENHNNFLTKQIEKGKNFIASEFIPGDDTNLYAYNCYRSKDGEILNEWSGKKLNQDNSKSGNFSTASNEAPDIIVEQGRAIVEAMDLQGISEVEFKYDYQDRTYKFMEINLRSTAWNRVGHLSGVNLHHSQYLDSLGLPVPKQNQNKSGVFHLVFMKSELKNLFKRRGYWKNFKHNIFGAKKISFIIFDPKDPMPFFFELIVVLKTAIIKFFKLFNLFGVKKTLP